MSPEAVIEIRFKTKAEGGRQGAVVGEYFACPLIVDGEAFECRLLLGGKALELGKTYEVPIKFMNPALVLPKLAPEKPISLWAGREVANGKVVRLV